MRGQGYGNETGRGKKGNTLKCILIYPNIIKQILYEIQMKDNVKELKSKRGERLLSK